MEINLTAEQEAQLSHIAALEGKGADEIAREAFSRGLAAEASRQQESIAPALIRSQLAGQRIRELRRGVTLGGLSIRELIDEGRE